MKNKHLCKILAISIVLVMVGSNIVVGASTMEYSFTIRSEELSIEALEYTVGRGDDIIVKVNGYPRTYYYLIVTGIKRVALGETSVAPEIIDTEDVKALDAVLGDILGDAYPAIPGISIGETNLAAWIKTGSDGIADVKIDTTGADARTYMIKVYRTTVVTPPPMPTFAPDAVVDAGTPEADEDRVDVKVVKPAVAFDMPVSAVIGEEVTIRGVISAGDYVDIIIKDHEVVEDDKPVDYNNEFEVKWDTAGYTTGSYTVEAYIDFRVGAPAEVLADFDVVDADGKTTIRLVTPGLDAEQPRNVIAEGDFYTIEGTATGTDEVDIVLVGPKGYSAMDPGLSVLNGLEIMASSVTDDEFSEDITMMDGVDTGTWVAMVFSPGRDGVYGWTWLTAGNLDGIAPTAIFAGKTQSQIVAIFKDFTVDEVGSDDLLCLFTFKVESPYVRFDHIGSVTIGEPLEITGTTNREPGTEIGIWTFAGPTELPPVITEVEWPTADQGVFTATIDTTDAVLGTYTLKADDGDGHSDTTTIEIVKEKTTISISTDKFVYNPGDTMIITISFKNPTASSVDTYFLWYLGLPDYGYWKQMLVTPFTLPPGYEQSFTIPIPVGNWGGNSLNAMWYVALLKTTPPYETISADTAEWWYVPIAKTQEGKVIPEEIAKEIEKGVDGVELPV